MLKFFCVLFFVFSLPKSKRVCSGNTTNTQPGRVAQSLTCLATDASLTADPWVVNSIPARSDAFVEIDHEIICTVILLPSAESFKKGCCFVVSYKRKYVHEVLVNCLFKLAQEKLWLGSELISPAMTIAVDLGCKATKQTKPQPHTAE